MTTFVKLTKENTMKRETTEISCNQLKENFDNTCNSPNDMTKCNETLVNSFLLNYTNIAVRQNKN